MRTFRVVVLLSALTGGCSNELAIEVVQEASCLSDAEVYWGITSGPCTNQPGSFQLQETVGAGEYCVWAVAVDERGLNCHAAAIRAVTRTLPDDRGVVQVVLDEESCTTDENEFSRWDDVVTELSRCEVACDAARCECAKAMSCDDGHCPEPIEANLIAASGTHTCAATAGASHIWCWGGTGPPQRIPLDETENGNDTVALHVVEELAVGDNLVCVLRPAENRNTILCHRLDEHGAPRENESVELDLEEPSLPNSTFSQLAVGDGIACALASQRRQDGVVCLDVTGETSRILISDLTGCVGDECTALRPSDLAIGNENVCVLVDGEVYCDGPDNLSLVGDGPFTEIAMGGDALCATTDDGVVCSNGSEDDKAARDLSVFAEGEELTRCARLSGGFFGCTSGRADCGGDCTRALTGPLGTNPPLSAPPLAFAVGPNRVCGIEVGMNAGRVFCMSLFDDQPSQALGRVANTVMEEDTVASHVCPNDTEVMQ